MRIAYIVPGVALSQREIDRRRRIASGIASPGVEIDVLVADRGPLTIESYLEEAYASTSYLPKLYGYRDRYDSFIVGCFGDPGVKAARELIDKPVIGPAEASFHIASMLGERFVVLAPLRMVVPLIRDVARALGFDSRVYRIIDVGKPVRDIAREGLSDVGSIASMLETHIGVDRGDVVVLGCMSMGFSLIDESLAEMLGVPVVNPVKVSIKLAEALASLGLRHSRVSYPRVDMDKVRHLLT